MLRPSIESQKPGEHQNCSEMARSIGREAMYHIPNTREEDAIIRRRETLIHTDLTSDPDAAEIAKVSQRQLFQLLETEPHGLTLDDIQGTQPEPVESPVGLPKYRDSKTP